MKTLFKSLFLLFTLFCISTTASAQEKKTVQTATIKTAIACNHCKVCETCGELFDKKLLREKGVQMVELNEEAMTIKVTYNSKKTDLSTIKQAISKLGYDADDIKADPNAYEKLDGCCKV
ncbi:heavy-metal-associated domain-containing protein [Flavobacterium arcticum]|uniref:Heavy-metal-associated domain-containing protein n=1 Tax=Flavobacterium arcticum TaxID=1784713 RepID=A0A345HBW9_9FLAO|nr:heavy metal-associated domain-containing protein [Flavobacterium arcticum]AXG74079.1 heavy-metal-associated domain-containing protein [Flavobacterium arcticum]KAF2507362.1 heavy-metal-associated domain-containing protein [Flavobacterium arcticum]